MHNVALNLQFNHIAFEYDKLRLHPDIEAVTGSENFFVSQWINIIKSS